MQTIVDGFALNDQEIRNFSVNEVIHAYKAGMDQGAAAALEAEAQRNINQIKENVNLAAHDTFKIIDYLEKNGIAVKSAHLKVATRYKVAILVTVSDADYVKDKFLDVYSFALKVQEESNSPVYSVKFKFINKSESFDSDAVSAGGYTAAFKPLEK